MGSRSSITTKITTSYAAVIIVLAVVVMIILYRGDELNDLSDVVIDNYVPSVNLSLVTLKEVETSMGALRGWVASGEGKYIEHRRAAWVEINEGMDQLTERARSLGKLFILQDLKTLRRKLDDLEARQASVEALAHTSENRPVNQMFENQVLPIADSVFEEISRLIHMTYDTLSVSERYTLLAGLADFRYSFSKSISSIRAYLASSDIKLREEFETNWKLNTENLKDISDLNAKFLPHQKDAFNRLISERLKFMAYPPKLFSYREGTEWNLAKVMTEKEVEPLAVKVSNDIQSIVNKFNNRMREGFSSMRSGFNMLSNVGMSLLGLAIISFGLLAAFLSRLISQPLNRVIEAAHEVAQGDFDVSVNIGGSVETERLSDALTDMMTFLRRITEHADNLSNGLLDKKFVVQSEKDRLGIALNKMTVDLRERQKQSDLQAWYKGGLAELADEVWNIHELEELTEASIRFIANYLDAQLACFYLYSEDSFRWYSGYSFHLDSRASKHFEEGEGFIGQTAIDQRRRIVRCDDSEQMVLDTGLGLLASKCVVASPVINRQVQPNDVLAVLVLAFTRTLQEHELDLLDEFCDVISVRLASCQSRDQLQQLLLDSQKTSEMLQQQQEELRVNNEELEQQAQSLAASEEEMKTQSEALRESNQHLEHQKAVLETKNQELDAAKDAIERKAQELAQISRYKSEFLANMSHELRTPLNSLLILSDALRRNTQQNLLEEQLEDLLVINQAGHVLLSLINDILDLSKVEAGKLQVHFEKLSLQALVDEMRKQFAPIATSKSITFLIDYDSSCFSYFNSDPQRLAQIVRNLLSNAFKFTEQGSVTLSLTGESKNGVQQLTVSVKDTGIGIAKELQSDIFGAFKQVDGSTKRAYGGSGLGLTISKELAQMLGGDIEVDSEEGKGSCFRVVVPERFEADNEEIGEVAPDTTEALQAIPINEYTNHHNLYREDDLFIEDDRDRINHGMKSVLIVEDDFQFAQILRDFSRQHGFGCLITNRGQDALKLAHAYLPKAIILDVGLPDISGVEVLEQLKKDKETSSIPVHIVSGQDDQLDLMRQGALDVLQKPISVDALEQLFSKFSTISKCTIQSILYIGKDEQSCEGIASGLSHLDVVIKKLIFTSGSYSLQEMKEALQQQAYDCCIIELDASDIAENAWLDHLSDGAVDVPFPPSIIYTDQPLSDEQYRMLAGISNRIVIKGDYAPERIRDEVDCFLHSINERFPVQSFNELLEVGDIDLSGRKILLVDDDLRNTYALSKVLQDYGMSINIADNGALALEKFRDEPDFDLVLMDIMMPVMDGYEAIKSIRSEYSETVPIIALTAKAMPEDREKCLEVGASDYLSKPVELDRLISMIKVWVDG